MNQTKKRIVLTGGGSGGHIIPNLALIEYIGDKADIFYIGTSGMEKSMVGNCPNVTFYEYSPPKFRRSFSLKNLKIPFEYIESTKIAKKYLEEIKPNVVFTKGGYVGLPVVAAAKKLKIVTVGHESDSTLGLAHKLFLPKYDKFFTTFAPKKSRTNVVQSGAILRQSIGRGNREKGLKITCFSGNRPILLVMGGSLGAENLNKVIHSYSKSLCKKYDIFVITGKGKNNYTNTSTFHSVEFVENIADVYSATTVCITRGGANALSELVHSHIPFLAVPLCHSSRNEQIQNARYFVDRGVGLLMFEDEMTDKKIEEALRDLVDNRTEIIEKTKKTALDGTKTVADYLLNPRPSSVGKGYNMVGFRIDNIDDL